MPGPPSPSSPQSCLPLLGTAGPGAPSVPTSDLWCSLPKALGALELGGYMEGEPVLVDLRLEHKGQAEAPAGSWARTPPRPGPSTSTPHPCPYPTCTQILIGVSSGGPDLKQWLHEATSEQNQKNRSESTDPNRAQALCPVSQ